MIDWMSESSHWLLPSHFSRQEKKWTDECRRRLTWVNKHIWIATSGTTRRSGVRWVGLSKNAMRASAEAVNRHLSSSSIDVWINVLPTYHVGGLSILVRAGLSRSKVIDFSKPKWDAKKYIAEINKHRATLTSLVPTQVYDLVEQELRSPVSLRATIVGGAALDPMLYHRARALGWPLLPTYGMTECCSQVATADLLSLKKSEYPELRPLSHVELQLRNGRLAIRSESIATFVTRADDTGWTLEDPRRDEWLISEDLVELQPWCGSAAWASHGSKSKFWVSWCRFHGWKAF